MFGSLLNLIISEYNYFLLFTMDSKKQIIELLFINEVFLNAIFN